MTQRRLTKKAQELVQSGKELVPWVRSDSGSIYVFVGDFYNKGVDLTAANVLSIQADHVFADAKKWAGEWNEEHPEDLLFFAGIDYLGPVDGKWWEKKGEKFDDFGISRGRYHKFGGLGEAHILTLKR